MRDKPRKVLLRIGKLSLALCLLTQCKPKDTAEAPPAGPGTTAPTPAAPVRPPSLADHAAKLGFAANLPLSTELYFGSVNFKSHLAALKESAFYRQVEALVEDKTPAPAAGDKTRETLEGLWGDDFFVAASNGFAQSAALLKDFNQLYNEVYFKALMTGGAASLKGDGGAPNPLIYVQAFLNDPDALARMGKLVADFELPPLIIGLKTDKPEEKLKELITPDLLEELRLQNITVTDFKTSDGHDFKMATLDVSKLLPESSQASALDSLPKDLPEQSRKIIEKAYDDLQAKKLVAGWGIVNGHIILAFGNSLDHLQFVTEPAKSVLAKPEMAYLLPFAEKNLALLSYVNAASLDAMNDEQPFAPMLRGIIAALKENETFGELGKALDQQMADLAPLESKTYARECTNLTAAVWWEKGIHMEAIGGMKPRAIVGDKALTYPSLVNQPGVVFGIDYQRNLEYEKAFQAWSEKLVSMVYTTAQKLMAAGIAGPESAQKFEMFNTMFAPALQKIYAADREMSGKGLGTEAAYIVDVNGKMPALPGVPPESKGMKFPRITSLHEVVDRKALATGWTAISSAINEVSATMSSANPGAPLFTVPDPITSDKNGVTTYFFGLPFLSGDLLPCASVNDKLLVLSTSKEAAESFAGMVREPVLKGEMGCVWKFDLSTLADYVSIASALSPSQTPEQAEQIKENLKWIKPFHAMEGQISQKNGQWHTTLDWEIKDMVSFD